MFCRLLVNAPGPVQVKVYAPGPPVKVVEIDPSMLLKHDTGTITLLVKVMSAGCPIVRVVLVPQFTGLEESVMLTV